jgi:PAS domain S-box-containing protein
MSRPEQYVASSPNSDRPNSLGTQLQHSEDWFRLLVAAVQDYAIFGLDPEGRISSWNAGAQRIKGYTASEIIGRHFSCFYSEEDKRTGKPARELEIATREGRVEDEGWRLRKDGSKFWANVIITALRKSDGNLVGFAKVTRDVTEKMQAREALEKTNEELRKEVLEKRNTERNLQESERSLRTLSRELLRSQDEERRRIGRDLHDSIGQYLAVLKMKLDSVTLPSEVGPRQLLHTVAECSDLTDECIKEVRTISYLLHPPMLEEMGLRSAISWYLDGFMQRSGIKATLDIAPELTRFPRDVELAIFRVLQESLTNVHRHSGSPTVHVRAMLSDGSVILEVQDRGKGLPPAMLENRSYKSPAAFGVGLRGMSERTRQLGGTLELSSDEHGTTVRAAIAYVKSAATPIVSALAPATSPTERPTEAGARGDAK